MAAAILVVEPFSKSLKVWPFMEEAIISSEKIALTLVGGATPVAFALGRVLMTLVSHSAARQAAPEQALRASRRGCSSE
jgi:hypothetical protein